MDIVPEINDPTRIALTFHSSARIPIQEGGSSSAGMAGVHAWKSHAENRCCQHLKNAVSMQEENVGGPGQIRRSLTPPLYEKQG